MFAEHRGLKSRRDELELRVLSGTMNARQRRARWERGRGKKDPTWVGSVRRECLDRILTVSSTREENGQWGGSS